MQKEMGNMAKELAELREAARLPRTTITPSAPWLKFHRDRQEVSRWKMEAWKLNGNWQIVEGEITWKACLSTNWRFLTDRLDVSRAFFACFFQRECTDNEEDTEWAVRKVVTKFQPRG